MRLKLVFLLTMAVAQWGKAQVPFEVKVVNWNIEWLGSRTNGPSNKALQEQNAITILRTLNADLFALCEIVDTATMRRIVTALGTDYTFSISDYCSLAGSPLDADWAVGQKLCFVYRRSVFSNVRIRGMLRNSGTAFNNFASGRFPYLLNANVRKGSRVANMNFILIHAKSGATPADYARRRDACIELKDTMDAQMRTTPTLLVGDYNDDLDRTIVQNFTTTLSSYDYLVRDSVGPNGYKAVTLPASFAGESSTISFPDVIDHQVYNGRAAAWYLPNTARIARDVTAQIPNYNTRNTSDHFPIVSSFELQNADTVAVNAMPGTPPVTSGTPQWQVLPTAATSFVQINGSNQALLTQIRLVNSSGVTVQTWERFWPAFVALNLELSPSLPNGIYWLTITNSQSTQVQKILKQ
ncbi:MAG: T9SS C-terminal target domain-containing protein [Bacteroidetes bacterium]|nr:MAG: T9SS C-terminal target domain-containing protein [Bacteroidota bacterium]